MASFKLNSVRSSARLMLVVGLGIGAWSSQVGAQQQPTGFALDRFYPSAPGGGWFVMDDLNISGGLGGAIELTTDYARDPLVIPGSDGMRGFALVSDEALVDVGAAVTYDRYRLYFNIPMPVLDTGSSGAFGSYQLSAPNLGIANDPDTVSDPRLGVDARLFGEQGESLRLGVGAQIIFPSGSRSDYVSDARYRGMFRFLAAGDVGAFSYAGQLGVQVRPLVDSIVPGGADGSELLFGVSGGRKFPASSGWTVVVGPEIFGETAFRSFFGQQQTGMEGLMTARFERTSHEPHLRIKMGVGHGLVEHFGAPEWRLLAGVELLGQGLGGGN
jgi:hypothetical protein